MSGLIRDLNKTDIDKYLWKRVHEYMLPTEICIRCKSLLTKLNEGSHKNSHHGYKNPKKIVTYQPNERKPLWNVKRVS